MQKQVLLLAPASDVHAAALSWALARNHREALWQPSLKGMADLRYSISIDGKNGLQSVSSRSLANQLSAIWYRRPEYPRAEESNPADRVFVERQWKVFQKNAFHLGDQFIEALWVNLPSAAAKCESKLIQLHIAHEAGLLVPDTAVTNDAATVRQLIKRCNRVIYKTFYSHAWQDPSTGRTSAMDVALLDESSELPEAEIAVCPGIFQHYIDKSFDVRVTVIGLHMFAARLWGSNKQAYVDWRPHIADDDIVVEPFDLPAAVEKKLRMMMGRLNIVFGCIDLVADRDANLFFLEVNQQGQFLFIEGRQPKLPLLRAMTSMLSLGRTDYSIDDSIKVGCAEYLQSEEHQRALAEYVPDMSWLSIEAANKNIHLSS